MWKWGAKRCPVSEAEAADEGVGLLHLAGADHALARASGDTVDVVQDPELFCSSEYEVDAFDVGDLLGLQLGVAAYYNNLCTRVRA